MIWPSSSPRSPSIYSHPPPPPKKAHAFPAQGWRALLRREAE
jgi:hypothetical protein